MSAQQYYILTTAHGGHDIALFWGPDSGGYETIIDNAGRYSKEEADRIVKLRGEEYMIPCEVVEARAVRMVPWDLIREFIKETK